MKHKKILIVIFFSLFIISCNNGTEPEPTINESINNNFYPFAPNYEWEYNTTDIIEYYDTLGNIKNTEVHNLGNTIVRIESLNDTFGNLSNVIRAVSFEVGQSDKKVIKWYENKNDGLYVVAVKQTPSSQTTTRKINSGARYLNMDLLKQVKLSLDFNLFYKVPQNNSILVWKNPSMVFDYPLEVGNSWTDYNVFLYRDRNVDTKENININGNIYSVYKIVAIGYDFKFKLNDYVSTKDGLVMREILADSVVILAPNSDGILGFAKMKRMSKLVRKNF